MRQQFNDAQISDIETELARIFRLPSLSRAPKTRRLLQYLVDRAIAGESADNSVTEIFRSVYNISFPISPNDHPRARVAISRLRRTLDTIYRNGERTPVRFAIPVGSYMVDIVLASTHSSKPSGLVGLPLRFSVHANSNGDNRLADSVKALIVQMIAQLPEFEYVSNTSSSDYYLDIRECQSDFGHTMTVSLTSGIDDSIVWRDEINCSGHWSVSKNIASFVASYTFDYYTGCLFPHFARSISKRGSNGFPSLMVKYLALVRTHSPALIETVLRQLKCDYASELGDGRRLAMQADALRIMHAYAPVSYGSVQSSRPLKLSQQATSLDSNDPICLYSEAMSEVAFGQHDAGIRLASEIAASHDGLPSMQTDIAVLLAMKGNWAKQAPILTRLFERRSRMPYFAALPVVFDFLFRGDVEGAARASNLISKPGSFWASIVDILIADARSDRQSAHAALTNLLNDHPKFSDYGLARMRLFLRDQEAEHLVVRSFKNAGLELST